MLTFGIIAAGLVLLVIGIVFIVRGYIISNEEKKVVPISNLSEIPTFPKSSNIKPIISSEPPLSVHLMNENLRPKDIKNKIEPESNISEFQDENRSLKEKLDRLSKENADLTKALEREMNSTKTKTLSRAEENLLEEKGAELKRAYDSLANLTEENHKLTKNLEQYKSQVEELSHNLQNARNQSAPTPVVIPAGDRTKELELQLQKLIEEKDKALLQCESLLQSNAQWEEIWRENQRQIEELKERTAQSQDHYHKRIEDAQRTILDLKQKETSMLEKQKDNQNGFVKDQLKEMVETIQHLEKRVVQLEDEKNKLESQLTHLNEKSSFMQEKGKMLQYELTKSKAQALGLERICEDFKIQIEELSKV